MDLESVQGGQTKMREWKNKKTSKVKALIVNETDKGECLNVLEYSRNKIIFRWSTNLDEIGPAHP